MPLDADRGKVFHAEGADPHRVAGVVLVCAIWEGPPAQKLISPPADLVCLVRVPVLVDIRECLPSDKTRASDRMSVRCESTGNI